ncbi:MULTISPECIES: methionine ABC transporter permease [unclassified Streptococcus]|uniref:methionine ABC transporter permease n=1 Tax=unclassified Streptococcus TaxID=2608887 RepID=UPI00359EBE97
MLSDLTSHIPGIIEAFWETNFMVGLSLVFCLVIALPLGILLYALDTPVLLKQPLLYQVLSILLNTLRSIPYLIFIFILIPVSRFLFQTSFGNLAATLPLTLVSVSLYARFVDQALLNVPKGIIDRSISMGATPSQMIRYFLLPASKQDLVLSFTSTAISALSYSTVMGVIGAGGLGEYAYRYGYQEYNYPLMYLIVIIFVVYVFVIQNIGYLIAKLITK